MTKQIDLNADLGEGCPFDAELMSVVTSCNIASGGHAGDEASMRTALTLAKENNVAAGAHPSFPDRKNFGRTRSDLSGPALEQVLTAQVETLKRLAEAMDLPLTHLKPHGALYNMAARDTGLATSILNVLQSVLPDARLVGPPNSDMQYEATARGVGFVAEGFADRAYQADGQLRDRSEPGAMIHDHSAQARQAVSIATEGQVQTYDGKTISLPAKTICVHGDTPDAFAAAGAVRAHLEKLGVRLCAPY